MSASNAHAVCYSATCHASRTTTPTAGGPAFADGVVEKMEISFFYPFALTKSGEAKLLSGDAAREGDTLPRYFFGDDGHLLFRECKRTIAVISQVARRDTAILLPDGTFAMEMGSTKAAARDMKLAVLKDRDGNLYELHEAYIRIFSFNVAMLRFSVSSLGPVNMQAILNVQNSVMRLGSPKQAGRLAILNSKGEKKGDFIPKTFVQNVLRDFVGEETHDWVADANTDRLFIYTLAHISGLQTEAEVQSAMYNIGQMEWEITQHAAEDEAVRSFMEKECFLRFAKRNSGLWTSFHRDSGTTIFFGDRRACPTLPLFWVDRREEITAMVSGTTRPLAAFSLAEDILFQRTVLRSMDHTAHDLINRMDTRKQSESTKILQELHSKLLKFRAAFVTAPASSSSSCEQQFAQWASIVGISDTRDRLDDNVKDLRTYFSDAAQEASQQRLDALAVVLGFLGVSSLVTDIYIGYRQEQLEDHPRRDLVWVPSIVSTILVFCGVLFVLFTRSAL